MDRLGAAGDTVSDDIGSDVKMDVGEERSKECVGHQSLLNEDM